MKKTFQVSISGRIFNIEEDAYTLLLDYLNSLSDVFRGEDGREIVNDIEGRICELFSEKEVEGRLLIITRTDVDRVIETVGSPADLAAEDEELGSEHPAHAQSGSDTTAGQLPPAFPQVPQKKLFRCPYDSVLGGVLSGLAIYLGWNITLLRVLIVVLGFVTGFFPLFVIYCIFWIVMPAAVTPEQQLEQLGKPVNVNNLGNMILQERAMRAASPNALSIIGHILMGGIGLISFAVGIGLIIGLLSILVIGIIGLFTPTAMNSDLSMHIETYRNISQVWNSGMTWNTWWIAICALITALIPCIALVWAACSVLFKCRGASRSLWISAVAIEIIAVVALIVISICSVSA